MLFEIYVVQIRAQNLGVHQIAATILSRFQVENGTQESEEILSDVVALASVAEHEVVPLLFEHHSESGLLIEYSLIVDHMKAFEDIDEE